MANPVTTNAFDINSFVKPFDFAKQQLEQQNFLTNMGTELPRQQKAIEESLNLPALRQQFTQGAQAQANMQQALNMLPQTVAGTTRDSLVNESQRQSMINAQSAPLTRGVEALTAAQAGTQAAIEQGQKAGSERMAIAMLPFEKGYDLMTQNQAREFTGYTTANQLELDRLIKNQAAGLTWSTDEANRANALAIQEMKYKETMDSITKQGENAIALKAAKPDLATLYKAFTGA